MIAAIAAALLGAALGLLVRNGLVAALAAVSLGGVVQAAAMAAGAALAARPDTIDLGAAIQAQAGTTPLAVLPSLAAAGLSAVLAALLTHLAARGEAPQLRRPGERGGGAGQTRGVRAKTAVKTRAIHDRAESRLAEILRK